VTTALPLTDDEKKDVEKKLGGSVAEWRVDPSILGGIIVRAGDKVVDGSVRANMTSLAASLN
jgi:F0F1-type ATP synthase delta subunit